VLAPFDGDLPLVLARGALEPQHDLLSGLSLFPEDGLGLTTESRLFLVITATALRGWPLLGLLVLGYLERLVRLAVAAKRPL